MNTDEKIKKYFRNKKNPVGIQQRSKKNFEKYGIQVLNNSLPETNDNICMAMNYSEYFLQYRLNTLCYVDKVYIYMNTRLAKMLPEKLHTFPYIFYADGIRTCDLPLTL